MKSTGQDPQVANRRVEDGSRGGGCSKGLDHKERSLLRTSVADGGVDSPCVGEGRGSGARVAGAEILDSRSVTAGYDLDAPSPIETPSSCPSLTYACVEESLGKETRAIGVGAGGNAQDARSPDGGSPDGGSPDARFVETNSKGARGGRLVSHQEAGPSPRCAWGWVEKQLERKMEVYHECIGVPEVLFVDWSVKLPRSTVRHIVGRGGHTLQRIEDFCGVFVALRDIDEK